MERIGLIAGGGRLPLLFAQAAKRKGLYVVAIAHRGETDPALKASVDVLEWVRVAQLARIERLLVRAEVKRAVLAGGISRVRALVDARPDWGAVKLIASLRSLRDDALLRGVARHFERAGISIASPTELLPEVLAPEGPIAGPKIGAEVARDIELGLEVCERLGDADVGQTVVVRQGHVLALEAIEGTDEAIRRGGRLGGKGAVVVKLSKKGQDPRFDLPAVGGRTLEVMAEVGAGTLAIEAGRTILLDAAEMFAQAETRRISVVGVRRAR